jgi:hypothetical protein
MSSDYSRHARRSRTERNEREMSVPAPLVVDLHSTALDPTLPSHIRHQHTPERPDSKSDDDRTKDEQNSNANATLLPLPDLVPRPNIITRRTIRLLSTSIWSIVPDEIITR